MSDSKHTPGPWYWRCDIERDVYSIESPTSYSDTGWIYIATLVGGLDSGYYDARLIAAAPDLLEACQGLVNYLATFGGTFFPKEVNQNIDAIKVAIAKATGDDHE